MHFAIIGSRGYPSTYGGFETLVRHLAPYLVEQGHEVTVYCRDHQIRRTHVETRDGIRCIYTPGIEQKALSTLSYGLTAALDARRRRIDAALVVNVANGYFLPILRKAGIATAVNVDGIEWERAKWGRAAKAVFRYGARLTARYADEIVVDSKAIGDYWDKNFNRPGKFIPYGADITYPDSQPVLDLGLEPGTYLLVVARLVPENNIEMALTAAENANRNYPLVIVGSSSSRGKFETKLDHLRRRNLNIHWLGHVSDQALLNSLWAHSGAYFHGHSVGGTNPALLQAMACGAPIIAFDSSYNREVLGNQGTFVRGSDELHMSVQHLLDAATLRVELRKVTQAIIAERYSWDLVNATYRNVLESPGRPHINLNEPSIDTTSVNTLQLRRQQRSC